MAAGAPLPGHTATAAADLGARLERWFREAGLPTVRSDDALAEVAEENSRALLEVAGETAGAAAYLRFLLVRHGIRDATVAALAVRAADAHVLWSRLVPLLARRAAGGALSRYGIGVAASAAGRVATVLLVLRRVEISAVRAVVGRPLEICGRLLAGRRPQVLVTTPDGAVLERTPREAARFCAVLGRARRGRYQVEVLIEGPGGPEVAALFPLHVGVDPPALPERKLYPPERLRGAAAEARLLELLNRSRRAARLPPLREQGALTRAARRHSAEMAARGFFGHRSPERGDLTRRLAAEGLEYLAASENLALSSSALRAHDALLASPGHRKNILDPTHTHVGIGVAPDDVQGLLYVTECFARLP